MSKEGMTLADRLKAEAAQREKNCGEHPSLETLTDYALGELDEQVAEGLRDHLAFCQRCADQFLTIDGPLDFEIDMNLTQKPHFLKPTPATATVPVAPPNTNAPTISGRGRLRTWLAVAAAAACLMIGFQLGHRPRQHNLPQFALRAEGTQRNTAAAAITGDARDMVVYARNFDWQSASRCNIELVTPEGRRVPLASDHPKTPGILIMTVPTHWFEQPGEYRFDVWDSDRNNTPLTSLFLSVAAPEKSTDANKPKSHQ